MFDHLITLLPCTNCILWSYLLITRKGKSSVRACLAWLSLMAGAYFLLEAYTITPITDYREAVVIDLLAAFVTQSLFPTILILFRSMEAKDFSPTTITLLFTPSLLIGSTILIIYMTMGLKDAAAYLEAFDLAGGHPAEWTGSIYRLRDIVCIKIINASYVVWILTALAACILYMIKMGFRPRHLVDFYFHRKPAHTYYIIAVSIMCSVILITIRLLLGAGYFQEHIISRWIISILMTMSMFNAMFTGYRFDGALIDLRHFRDTSLIDEELKAFRESQQNRIKAAAGIVNNEDTLLKLRDLFIEYMDVEKPYLDPEMTLDDAASVLSTNRTYLSSMLKNTMGITFKTYINERRIEEVKRTLIDNPGSNLSEIADITGFASDSQLIKKFREIVGESPRAWVRKQIIIKNAGQ